MGFFESIGGFLGGDAIGDAIAAGQEYVMGPWNQAWDDLFGEGGMQEQTIEDYQRQFQELIQFFDAESQQAQEGLAQRQAEEMGYLGTGREASLQRVGQQFEQLSGQTQAQNIMQGLSNTSWGQQSLGAVTEQRGLAEADIETAYADRFAQTAARQGRDMAAMEEWRVGGGTRTRGQYAEGLAGLRGNWATRRMGMEQYGAGLRGGWAQQNIGLTERNVGVGLGLVGNVASAAFGF